MSSDIGFEQDEMQEFIEDFLVEADELIVSLDNNFIKLESSPDDSDLLNEIFRAAHTIKGTSSFLGFEQVTTVSHKMEDILNKLRKSEMEITSEVMDTLLEGLDVLKELLENVKQGITEQIDISGIIDKLVATYEADKKTNSKSKSKSSSSKSKARKAQTKKDDESDDEFDEEFLRQIESLTTSVSMPKGVELPKDMPETKNVTSDDILKKYSDTTIRVDVDRVDALMDMMGELVLGRNSLTQSLSILNNELEGNTEIEKVNHATNSISFITTELQVAVMKMRMLPVGKVFNRYPRLVRDLCRESKKQIELIIKGESTELDRSVIEEIGDPLVHIIMNSCDHGIESPAEREAKGKPAKGTVQLIASQEGSNIVLKIIDDGKGLDLEAIKAKAVERNLATEEEIGSLSRKEIFNFIFEAGFSTAKKVTGVSGRGVGMDVVRTNIEKLNGIVELESEIDVGTTLSIKLPLTLAMIQGLLVEINDEVFVLPLASVHETINLIEHKIFYVNQKPVVRLRDEIIPVMNISHLLRNNKNCFEMEDKPYVVVVGFGDKKLGVNIDRFLGQEEVVVKSLGGYLGSVEGISGATILGDGRIRLIVDIAGMFSVAKKLRD